MTMTDAAAPRGLKGVIVADTALGDVRGLEGFYHYRQYSAPELAATRTFEDVWYLLFEGELPSLARRDAYTARDRGGARTCRPRCSSCSRRWSGATTPPLGGAAHRARRTSRRSKRCRRPTTPIRRPSAPTRCDCAR